MNDKITISERSKTLIAQFNALNLNTTLLNGGNPVDAAVNIEELTRWLMEEMDADKDSRFVRELLRLSLLEDLQESFLTAEELEKKQKSHQIPWYRSFQFIILALAGTILAVCDGFNGITAILALFNPTPLLVFTVGVAFSVLSVVIFQGIDLLEISKNVGVRLAASKALLDTLVRQIEIIEDLRKKIDNCYFETNNKQELKNLQNVSNMLLARFAAMKEARQAYETASKSPYLNVVKLVMSLITGVLFFSSGFFTGQSLAIPVAELFVASASATFPPVLLASIAVGVAAFCVYWYLERPGLENLVACWFGVDKEKTDKLADKEVVAVEMQALQQLKKKLNQHLTLQEQLEKLSTPVEILTQSDDEVAQETDTALTIRLGESKFILFVRQATNGIQSRHQIVPPDSNVRLDMNAR